MKKRTTRPKLFHEDEFLLIIDKYNNMDTSTSRLFEIINDKAEKITSLNAELLEALKIVRNYFGENDKTLAEHKMFAIADKAIKKATE